MAQMAHAYREKRDPAGPPVSPNRAVGGSSGSGHEPDMLRPFVRRTGEALSEANDEEV